MSLSSQIFPNGEYRTNVLTQLLQMSEATDATCEFAFHLGGELVTGSSYPITFTFDDISLSDLQYTKPTVPPPRTLPIVRVNQVGYLPNAQKRATVISSSTSALDWSLKDGSGTVVTSGKTTPRSGVDAASGETVHHLDFSKATKVGYWIYTGCN